MSDENDLLERALDHLGRAAPDAQRSCDAVTAALARVRRPKTRHFRRWIMPASFAAAAATVLVALWINVTLTPASTASAAEVFKQAIEKRARFEGTVDIDRWDPAKSKWIPKSRAYPSLSRSIHWGDENVASWAYDDWKEKIQAEYHPADKAVYAGDIVASEPSRPPMPFDEETLLSEASLQTDEWTSTREASGDELRLLFKHHPKPRADQPTGPDAPPATLASDPVPQPDRVRVVLSKETGLIQSVEVAMTPDAKAFIPALRYRYTAPDGKPAPTWESLPVVEGTKRIDNRLTPEVRAWLAARDELYDKDLGFEAAVIARYHVSPFDDRPREMNVGSVTIHAGNKDRYFFAQWTVGNDQKSQRSDRRNAIIPLPANWPKPTFADVMDVVRTTRPEQFAVYDGTTLWSYDSFNGLKARQDKRAARDRWIDSASVQSQIWPHSSELLGGGMGVLHTSAGVVELWPDERKIVTFTRNMRWQEKPNELSPFEVRRLNFATEPGGRIWAESLQETTFGHSGKGSTETTQTDFDGTSVVRLRDDVRVPTFWRRISLNLGMSPSYTLYTRLIPELKQTVPQEWFGDPIKTWPEPAK